MKLGTMVYLGSENDMRVKFEQLAEYGFGSCQLGCWDPESFTEENAEMVKRLIAEYGVTVSAFWCGWEGPKVWDLYEGQTTLGLVPEEWRNVRVKNLCDGADFAKKIGITDVVTHMGFIPENPMKIEFDEFCEAVGIVARHLEKNEQYLLFETGQETPVTMLRCFEKVGTDNLGVNLDTANLILYGRANPVDALDVFGKYVRNIHAKDGFYPTNGHDLGLEVPIGEGKVDFKALFTKLYEIGYNAFVTIECEISGDQSENIKKARDYLTDIIKEIYGGNALC